MVGIVGYGVYIPLYRIKTQEIANVWGRDIDTQKNINVINEKSVPGIDEDSVTMSTEAALNALKMANIDPKEIGAIYSGSENPAYAVKPNASIISNAIGMGHNHTGADMEFACKAGTAALQVLMGLAKSKMIKYGLAIGSDAAEINVESVVDQGGGAGGAAFIIGNDKNEIMAEIEDTVSYTSDITDFWRRPKMRYPSHGERFTGEPAYFKHTMSATKMLMEKNKIKPSDVDHVAFHTPNIKFTSKIGKALGFSIDQLKAGFVVDKIGNTYSAASLIGLASILDSAKPGERIIVTSFGSGAGSDSFLIKATDLIGKRENLDRTTRYYLDRKKHIDYLTYCKITNRIE